MSARSITVGLLPAGYRRRFPDGRIGSKPRLATPKEGQRFHDTSIQELARTYAQAARQAIGPGMSVPFLACMAAAAAFYHLPPLVLPSIQAVEGGRAGLVRINTNGTADLGLMQVNTIWVKPLAELAHMQGQAVIERLVHDACFNVAAAAAIMHYYLTESHGNLMVAIGYYHSHTPGLGAAYQDKVVAAAGSLFGRQQKRQ